MAEKKKYPEKEIPMDADNLLLAFTIQFQGNYSEEKLQKRRSWIEKNGNILTDAEYADAAAGAKKKYQAFRSRLRLSMRTPRPKST